MVTFLLNTKLKNETEEKAYLERASIYQNYSGIQCWLFIE